MKRSILFAYGISLLLLAILVGIYLAQPNPLGPRLRQVEHELIKARVEIASLKAGPGNLEGAQGHSAAATGLAAAAKTSPGERNLNPATYRGPPIGGASTTSDSAAQREAAFKYQEPYINTNYGRFFKQLGLSATEIDHFKHLLADCLTSIAEANKATGTPEQRHAAMADAKAKSDAVIKHFLNNDKDYKAYQEWDDAQLQRNLIQRAVSDFDAAGENLSSDQRDQLYNLMRSHRITPADRPSLKHGAQVRTRPRTPAEASEDHLQLQAERAQSLLKQAATFLSPAQLTALQQMQDRQRYAAHQFLQQRNATAPAK